MAVNAGPRRHGRPRATRTRCTPRRARPRWEAGGPGKCSAVQLSPPRKLTCPRSPMLVSDPSTPAPAVTTRVPLSTGSRPGGLWWRRCSRSSSVRSCRGQAGLRTATAAQRGPRSPDPQQRAMAMVRCQSWTLQPTSLATRHCAGLRAPHRAAPRPP